MDFTNINVRDKVMVHHEGFKTQQGVVVKKLKSYFKVYSQGNHYDFFYNGKPKTKTFIPMSISL